MSGVWRACAAASLLVACSEPAFESKTTPIILGTPSTAADFPAVGAMLFTGTATIPAGAWCSGVLIAPDVVVTAAHCVRFPLGEDRFFFTLTPDVRTFGVRTSTLPPQTVAATAFRHHPRFNPDGWLVNGRIFEGLGAFYDVGLVVVDPPFENVRIPTMIEADDSAFVVERATVDIVGYGQQAPLGDILAIKHHATTELNEVGPAEMQVGTGSTSARKCRGDSGGPTVIRIEDGKQPADRIVGLTSRVYGLDDCNVGAVDSRVDFVRAWIESEMVALCEAGVRKRCADQVLPLEPGPNGPRSPDAGLADLGAEDATIEPGHDAERPDVGVSDVREARDAGAVAIDGGSQDAGRTGSVDSGFAPDDDSGCSTSGLEATWLSAVMWIGLVLFRRKFS